MTWLYRHSPNVKSQRDRVARIGLLEMIKTPLLDKTTRDDSLSTV